MSYPKIKASLNNFFAKHIQSFNTQNDNSGIHQIMRRNASIYFYENMDMPLDDIEIYILCRMSYGKGDLVNSVKTYNILSRTFKNVSLLVEKAKYTNAIKKLYPDNDINIMYYENISKIHKTRIFIACALPVYFERFQHIPGPKKYIFIDEYNGWRITSDNYIEEAISEESVDNDEESIITIDKIEPTASSKKCQAKHNGINKLSCDICMQKEYYQTYTLDSNVDNYRWNNDITWCVSSGFGLIQNSIPAFGVHIVDEKINDIDELDEDEIYDFIKLAKNNYYFAYLSIIPGYSSTTGYLKRYMELMTFYHKKKYPGEIIYFIVLDPSKHIYKNNTNLFFKEGDKIKILHDKYIVEDKSNMMKILYLKKIPHETMLTLMKYSHPFIFLSGDQSMVEGISMHIQKTTKIIFYQIQRWKRKFIDEFHNISKKILSENSSLINLQINIFSSLNHTINIHSLAEILFRGEDTFIKESGLVYDYIIKNYNIADLLVPMIYRVIHENDDIVRLTATMVDKFISNKDFKKEYNDFTKRLNIKPNYKRKDYVQNKPKSSNKKQKVNHKKN